jgi:HEAT repeat protein
VANYKPPPTGTPDIEVQGMAAYAVEHITGAKDVVPTLVAILRDEKVEAPIRRKTFEALQQLGPRAEKAEPALIAILQDRGKRLEAGDAAATLVGIGPGAVLSLANCFRFLPKANRCLALEELQRMGPAAGKAAPVIRRALRDPDPEVSGLAWKGLSCLGSEAVAVLVPLVENGDGPIRCQAIEALGAMGPAAKDAIPALQEAMEDASSPVRIAARRALKKIRP